jgi:hypothetical protein
MRKIIIPNTISEIIADQIRDEFIELALQDKFPQDLSDWELYRRIEKIINKNLNKYE